MSRLTARSGVLALALAWTAISAAQPSAATIATAATEFNQFVSVLRAEPSGNRSADLSRIAAGRQLAASPELAQVGGVELVGALIAGIDGIVGLIQATPAGTDYRQAVVPRAQDLARIGQQIRDRIRAANGGVDTCTACVPPLPPGTPGGSASAPAGTPSEPHVLVASTPPPATGGGNAPGDVSLVGITASSTPQGTTGPAGSTNPPAGSNSSGTGTPSIVAGSNAPNATGETPGAPGNAPVSVVLAPGSAPLPTLDGNLPGSPTSVVLSSNDIDQLAAQIIASFMTAQQNGARLVVQQVAGDAPGQTSIIMRLDNSGALTPPAVAPPQPQAPPPPPPAAPTAPPPPDTATQTAVTTTQTQQELYEIYGSLGFLFPSDPNDVGALLGLAPGSGSWKWIRIKDTYGEPMVKIASALTSGLVHARFPAESERIATQIKKIRDTNYNGTYSGAVTPEAVGAFQGDLATLKAMMDDLYQKVQSSPA